MRSQIVPLVQFEPSPTPDSHRDRERLQQGQAFVYTSELNFVAVPTASILLTMTERFFDTLAPIWPFVQRDEIMLYLQHLRDNRSMPRLPMALLYIIWALAMGSESMDSSQQYYKKTMMLLDPESMRKPSRVLSKLNVRNHVQATTNKTNISNSTLCCSIPAKQSAVDHKLGHSFSNGSAFVATGLTFPIFLPKVTESGAKPSN